MMRLLTALWLLCICSAGLANAGPNAGGTLLVHTDTSITYTTDTSSYIGLSGLECEQDFDCPPYDHEAACQAAQESANPTGRNDDSQQVWWVLAAFPEGSCPRLSGLTFGIGWDVEENISIVTYGHGGDFELPSSGWPAFIGEGTAVTWGAAQQQQMIEVYWFAGATYYGEEEFRLLPHPTQEGNFADDAVPSNIDPIAGYSILGLGGATGQNVLPEDQGPVMGACCFADGSCEIQTQAKCELGGGTYQGDNSTCEDANCPLPMGACCYPSGACQVQAEADCITSGGSYQGNDTTCEDANCPQPSGACCFADGSCQVLSETDCVAGGGTYQGTNVTCEDAACAVPTGACCFEDGSCQVLTDAECTAGGGTYQGNDVACEDADCAVPTGACCYVDGSCTVGPESSCSKGGTYQGDGTTCEDANCPQPSGACCFADGSCQVLSPADCETAGGTYQGNDIACETANCAEPTGACCFTNGECLPVTETLCTDSGGTYQGDGTTCEDANCQPITGACCFPDGSCEILTQDDCALGGGQYQGNDMSCEDANCPQPSGACCFADGSCQLLTESDCTAGGGSYQGNDTTCEGVDCGAPTGACCLSDGDCVEVSQEQCIADGGTYQGDDTLCVDTDCPLPTGACCVEGACTITTSAACSEQNGEYLGDGTGCEPNPCFVIAEGACCFTDGSCLVLEPAACNESGGSYQGDGTTCEDADCPQPGEGACCFSNGTCSVLTEEECATQGGAYQGDNATCDPNPCVGTLEVTSTPSGSHILLNNVDTGFTTPHTFDDLAPGDYIVEWVRPGYRGCRDTYTVVAGETTDANCNLAANFVDLASLGVTATPSSIDLSPGHGTQPVKLLLDRFTGNLTAAQIDTRFLFLNGVRLTNAVIQSSNTPNGTVRGGLQVTVGSDVVEAAIGALPPNIPQQRVTIDVWARLTNGRWVLSKLTMTAILRGGALVKASELPTELAVVARPNPMQSDVWIEWTAMDSAPTRLSIYDAQGREIRELVAGALGSGLHQYQWDGRDANGTSMPSGVYYYRLLAGENLVTEKIYLVR